MGITIWCSLKQQVCTIRSIAGAHIGVITIQPPSDGILPQHNGRDVVVVLRLQHARQSVTQSGLQDIVLSCAQMQLARRWPVLGSRTRLLPEIGKGRIWSSPAGRRRLKYAPSSTWMVLSW